MQRMLRKLSPISILILILTGSVDTRSTITAASCSRDNVWTAMQAAGEGDVVVIPACSSGVNWTTEISWTAPANVTLLGAGDLGTLGGNDQTVIINMTTNPNIPMLTITIPSTGVFRMAGITFREGPITAEHTVDNSYKNHAVVQFNNGLTDTSYIRFDHNHFDSLTNPMNTHAIGFTGWIYGVIDHNQLDFYSGSALYFYNGYRDYGSGNDYGSHVWTETAQFGTNKFIFVEDNYFLGTDLSPCRMADTNGGSRVVWRFNTSKGCSGIENHALGHTQGGDRGPRAQEGYGNKFIPVDGGGDDNFVPQAMGDCSSGACLYWGNIADALAVKNGLRFALVRRTDATYVELTPPNGWGYCSGPVKSGTLNVAANGIDITKVSGDNFDTNWTNQPIVITGALCDNFGAHAASTSCRITSVASTSAATLAYASSTGALSGVAWRTGSEWDGNTDRFGYPCMDQAGRGAGQLLTGIAPDAINSVTGNRSYLNQAAEPMYVWNFSVIPHFAHGGATYSNQDSDLIVAGRDYFPQASGVQTDNHTPFDGTQMVTAWGPIAFRPATCTFNETLGVGPGYFATDEGDWNVSTSNPYGVQQNGADGQLYTCTADNTWSLYYEPYTYPNPLQNGVDPESGPTGRPKAVRRLRGDN